MRKSPRDRRLNSDFRSVQKLMEESTIFSFHATGNPPQRYRLIFRGSGFCRNRHGTVCVSNEHEVLVELGAAYPRMVPNLAWQTPIFHPNISNNGVVCLGGFGTHWVPSLTLSEMATMLWDMIRYKNFDTESPYNREAALWAKMQSDFRFPIDSRSIRDRISGAMRQNKVSEVCVTRVSQPVNPDEIIHITDDGIEIIDAVEVVNPQPPSPADNGILFLD